MYNRYIPGAGGYTRITEEDAPPVRHAEPPGPLASAPPGDPHPPEAEKGAGALASLLKSLKLDQLDSGDVLLLLILLFLFMEGDDVELMITLGLLLLLGLD
ncbi:hypothetical protein [Pseudoflavonifractor intestinihominis]|uniref:Uncharacterized protein n=1 Tax=Pseudoflavonifractor intestinihominis TaxID=3133171 RepID=A0ABV1E6X4_9FIRM|nr:hypothetical protein [uncultured Pseudoflavonifractor sp.]